jgi:serine/threonine protein kinase
MAGPARRLRARLADTGAPSFVQPAPRAPVVPDPRVPLGGPAPRGTLVEQTPCPGARFELVRSVGKGGFGGVWLAVDHRTGSQVALKAAHVPDRDTELRLRREAKALGSVRHPHCVRILDLVDSRTDPGLAGHLRGLVIVMEYLPGRTLADILADHGPMDDRTAGRLWLLIASALSAAHQQGVLHRDVKPGNVVVDPRGDPHLIDFGIARARGDATLTVAGMVIGTPDFLAPEVARGEPASPASDCWQLAATMSFALTGQLPRGECTDAVAAPRSAAAATTPRYLPTRSVHHQLARACLAPDPATRPPGPRSPRFAGSSSNRPPHPAVLAGPCRPVRCADGTVPGVKRRPSGQRIGSRTGVGSKPGRRSSRLRCAAHAGRWSSMRPVTTVPRWAPRRRGRAPRARR